MSALVLARRRPALAAALTGVALVIAMLVVPVSYERVSGHDVALTLIGTGIRAADLRSVAGDLRARLGSDGVRVEEMERGSTSWVLRTTSSNRSRAEVERLAGAYARELVGKGYSAGLRVAPHRERVRYPVVAYAWDQIIRISVDGKSASELESEIRQRLAEAGVPDAQVSVTDRPEGGREISLNVERQRFGDVTTPEPEVPQVELTKGGAPLTGGFTVKVKKLKKDGGPITLVVEVGSGGKTATAEVPGSDSMSDGDLANAIVTQLRQAGLNVRVSVRNGEIKIDPVE